MAKSPPEADETYARFTTAQPPYAPSAEPGPMPPQPVPPDGERTAPELTEEIDVWWGSYSMATMVPSLLVCLLLTGLIIWVGWAFVPRGYVKVIVLGLAGAVWLVCLIRYLRPISSGRASIHTTAAVTSLLT